MGLGQRYQSGIYFTEGHQEPSIYQEKNNGLSDFKNSLNKIGIATYSINPNLASIPKNCKTLVIVSPKQTFTASAIDRIQKL